MVVPGQVVDFKDDELARADRSRDLLGRRDDIAKVGIAVARERGWHADDEHVLPAKPGEVAVASNRPVPIASLTSSLPDS